MTNSASDWPSANPCHARTARRLIVGLKIWKPGEPGCESKRFESASSRLRGLSPEFELRASRRALLDLASKAALTLAGLAAAAGVARFLAFDPNPNDSSSIWMTLADCGLTRRAQ